MGAANKGGKMWVRAARATEAIHENLSLKFSFSWEQYDRRLGCRLINVREYRWAANKSKSGKKKFVATSCK